MSGLLLRNATLVLLAAPIVVTGLWAFILCADAIKEHRWFFVIVDFCAVVFVVQLVVAFVKVGIGG